MHGRHNTVRKCLEKMPFIDKYMVYTNPEDKDFLCSTDVKGISQFKNSPLSEKWQHAISLLDGIDFDGVIILGSDDYIDENFLSFIQKNINDFDLIAFTDIYFEQEGKRYYWGGYDNHRAGEPAGAGKVYSKKFLQKIKFNLFPENRDRGLDGVSWKVCKNANAKMLITSLKQNDLFLCDIKDGQGMTELNSISNLKQL